MSLSTINVRQSIQQHTELFLREGRHQHYNELRGFCLSKHPVPAITQTFETELDRVCGEDKRAIRSSLEQRALDNQRSSDRAEERADAASERGDDVRRRQLRDQVVQFDVQMTILQVSLLADRASVLALRVSSITSPPHSDRGGKNNDNRGSSRATDVDRRLSSTHSSARTDKRASST